VSRRVTLILVAIAALVLAVSAALPALRGIGSVDIRVPTYEVARGDFVRRVHAEGNLDAVDATLLGPPAEITRPLKIAWLAPDGTPVAAGDVVIRFDPSELERELQDGRYDRATADSRIDGRSVREQGSLRNLERDAELAGVELE